MTTDALPPGRTSAGDRPAVLTVGDVMRPPATTVEPQAHLAAAAYLMKRSGDNALLVISDDEDRRPIAILTDTDISHAVADGRDLQTTRISELHRAVPMTVQRSTTVEEAARSMLAHGIRHMPVVDGDRLVGLLDLAGVCAALLDEDPARRS
jgi:CBS domain-containing protein